MALTFDPKLRPTDDLRGNNPTIYGSYLYPTDLLRADRRGVYVAYEAPPPDPDPETGSVSYSSTPRMSQIATYALNVRLRGPIGSANLDRFIKSREKKP